MSFLLLIAIYFLKVKEREGEESRKKKRKRVGMGEKSRRNSKCALRGCEKIKNDVVKVNMLRLI